MVCLLFYQGKVSFYNLIPFCTLICAFSGIKKAPFSDACVFRYSFFKLRRQNRSCMFCF